MKHSARKDLKTYRLNLFLRFELFIYERLFIEWSFLNSTIQENLFFYIWIDVT